jgi:hypothetical protein
VNIHWLLVSARVRTHYHTHLEHGASCNKFLLLQHFIGINKLWFTGGPVPWPAAWLAVPNELIPADVAASLQPLQQLLER